MTTLSAALADVFDRGAEHRLALADELDAIADAKAGGDAGLLALVYAYAPVLRARVGRYREVLDADEARSAAVVGLLEAAHAVTEGSRLAGVVSDYIAAAMAEAAGAHAAVTIPTRTATRFFGILRRADGDVEAAAALAPAYQMSRETFFDCLRALRTGSLDEAEGATATRHEGGRWTEGGQSAGSGVSAETLWPVAADAGDRVLVEMAFAAVDDLETDICRLAYGFADYDPQPDAEIAHRLGFSRPAVQRRRSSALAKMRDALGA